MIRHFAGGFESATRPPLLPQHRGQTAARLTVASTMLSPIGGVSDVRVVEPLAMLGADHGVDVILNANGRQLPTDIQGPRIFVFHRPMLLGEPGSRQLRTLLDRGWIVICEFDDHPEFFPHMVMDEVLNFRGVHAVQTSTEILADVFREYSPNVMTFPNAVATIPEADNFAGTNDITFFFAGINREYEWLPFIDSINSVIARLSHRVKFEVISDRGFFEAIDTDRKNFTPICEFDIYKKILSRSEISFMPLSESTFNRCKSDLKFIEAASRRVVALARSTVYAQSIDDGRTGVLFDSPDQLASRLAQLITDQDRTRSIATAARQHVRHARMLDVQVRARLDWYRSLWSRREELNTSLRDRAPELFS